jgi:hypothetical protein
MLAAAFGALVHAGPSWAQAAVEKVASVSHEIGYASGRWSYIDGALYGADTAANTYPQAPLRLVRFDLTTGKLTTLGRPEATDTVAPFLYSQTRILTKAQSDWRTQVFRLLSRQTGEELTRIELRDEVFDITEHNGEFWMLQRGTVSRFNPSDLAYRGRIDLPSFVTNFPGKFVEDGVLGYSMNTPCEEPSFCITLQKVSLDGAIMSSIEIREKREDRNRCPGAGNGPYISAAGSGVATFYVNCRLVVTDAGVTRTLFRLPETAQIMNIAIGQNLLFAHGQSYQSADKTGYIQPLMVFDLASGELLTTREDMPGGTFVADGDNLIIWRFNKHTVEADTYRFNPERLRRLGPR